MLTAEPNHKLLHVKFILASSDRNLKTEGTFFVCAFYIKYAYQFLWLWSEHISNDIFHGRGKWQAENAQAVGPHSAAPISWARLRVGQVGAIGDV